MCVQVAKMVVWKFLWYFPRNSDLDPSYTVYLSFPDPLVFASQIARLQKYSSSATGSRERTRAHNL